MRKKINIAMLTMLLVFQTLLSPLSAFAEDLSEPLPEDTTNESVAPTDDGTSDDTSEEIATTSDDSAKIMPLSVGPLAACTGPQELTNVALSAFEMKIDGNPVTEGVYTTPLPKDKEANFHVEFDVLLDDMYCADSYFEFDLPASLIDFNGKFQGSKTVGNISYAYDTTGNKVRVHLVNDVDVTDVSTTTPAKMTMDFAAKFSLSANDIEQELALPKVGGGEAKTQFTFLPPTSNEKATKEATAGIPPVVGGNHQMEWTIWINKAGKDFNNPSLVDNPTGGHAIVPGSVNVYEYTVDLAGVASTGTQVVTDGNFSDIVYKNKHAYKIVYNTEVNLPVDQREGTKTFNNSVTFTNNGTAEPVNNVSKNITYGKALEKQKVATGTDNYTSKWEVRYNYNQASIAQASAKVTDTLPGLHQIDTSTIEVREMTIDDAGNSTGAGTVVTNYTVNPVADGFELQFNSNIDKAYKITYDAKYNGTGLGYYTGTTPTTINNTVVSGTKTDVKSHIITEGVLSKGHLVNFDTKEITWTIDIKADNPNEAINNLTLTDVFKIAGSKEGTHTLVGDENNITITGTTGAAPVTTVNGPTNGFTITGINITAGSTARITYKTSFAISNDGGVENGYGNTATVNWGTYTTTEQDHYTPATTTVNNGSKAGSFNYLNQLFTWQVKVNINKKDIQGAILTDTIGTGHEFVADSLKVYEYTLTTGDDTGGTKAATPIDASNYVLNVASDNKSYVLTFNNVLDSSINNKAYLVEYDTKDSDEILGIGDDEAGYTTGNVYSNTATFQTLGSKNYTLGATPVTLPSHVANNLIQKRTPTQSNPTITWVLDVNQSHSALGTNVALEDTPSTNLMLIDGSIKVRKYNVTSTSISTNGTGAYVDPSTYGITVEKKADGGFILHFANLNEGYQVQYQTLGLGQAGQGFNNDAKLTFGVTNASNQKDTAHINTNFAFSSSDSSFSTTKGNAQFKKVGVNSSTGVEEPLSGVQFQLYKKIGANKYLIQAATSDADGLFTFTNINYGNYQIEEVSPKAGYQLMQPQDFVLDAAKDTKLGSTVITNLVNLTPLAGDACPAFTLTVKDIDGAIVANKQIELIDSNGMVKSTVTTDNGGKVAIPSTVKAGGYTVKDSDGIDYGKVNVKFGAGECQGVVQPINACTEFTVTINDGSNNPRPNVTVTVKNSSNVVIDTKTTDSNGQFTFDKTTPAGKYKLYEGTQYLGEVNITYQNGNCQDIVTPAPKCEVFTLVINDADGKPRQGVTVVIKDKNNPSALVPQPNGATDVDGKVTITDLPPGEYEVYEGTTKINDFVVTTDCKADVQPAPSCPVFTLTVKDEDGILPEGTEVTITNTITHDSMTKTVGKDGEIKFPTNPTNPYYTINPGNYEVSITSSGKVIDDFDVSYTGNCEDTAEKLRACTQFEMTILNPDGTTPKAMTKVIVVDELGTETPYTTDANGKITLPQSQSPGDVTVYEANPDNSKGDKLGSVKVTYTDNCQGVVIQNACPQFTLTVNDRNLQPVGANVKVTIKDKATGAIVTSGITDANGQIVFTDKAALQQGHDYTVVNELDVLLGDITVSYTDSVCGAAVKVPDNVCPIFTLTIQDVNGKPRANVSFIVKTTAGKTIVTGTTDADGKFMVPYIVEPGDYYVYEGYKFIDSMKIQNCEGIAKPAYTGGGYPIEPEYPTFNPNPNQPIDPSNPKPDPNQPVDPSNPTPDPNQPVEPSNPTSGSNTQTNPGNNGNTAVQNVIDQGTKLPSYNDSTATKNTLDAYKDFLNKYSKLTKEEQAVVANSIDINKVKTDVKRLESLLSAQGKLPQTDGANQLALTFVGALLVAGAVLLMRRRQTEVK
ncbi:collagen binding domain-containing protein [Lysinibacillus piscis]|uniref:LPXTG cell wall anchor domain-containing protein n=1 Tax=Lysinibacillus piscis TaxID=2518931 RepID=A0ABQ5NI05_9BACI|nr:collagen binding domain-containing protein [Lysinibacillus sp. KH24]GLC87976.1 hypothetical protein LYSBPC_11030 [Lysinibacillus sp. KH24]